MEKIILFILLCNAIVPSFAFQKQAGHVALENYSYPSKSFDYSHLSDFLGTIPRGGSQQLEKSSKIQNLMRSILEILENKDMSNAAKILKNVAKKIETILGVKLLPVEPKKKSKKSSKKNNSKKKSSSEKRSSKETTEEDEDVQEERVVQKEKKKKSSSSSTKNASTKKKASTKKSEAVDFHLKSSLSQNNPNYRIQQELKAFIKSPPENLSVKVGKNIRVWIITLTGAKGSIYEGEKYRLHVKFPKTYPAAPPSVYFLNPTPRHEHVYTNGDICLSLLGKDWRPTMTAQSIALSILSILSSASHKALPQDNAAHAGAQPGLPQDDWVYHDDNC
mmetsp:Transcript_20958/g.31958  ORF Transcript_20958/g.31958 Transcript_20958/m.31958 type:complete len:334 (+) Transcript_20958:67-1068(+)